LFWIFFFCILYFACLWTSFASIQGDFCLLSLWGGLPSDHRECIFSSCCFGGKLMAGSTISYGGGPIPVLWEGDVVVCGGGAAGVAAAVSAARAGWKVVLLEKSICAGGMLTNGLLPSIIHMTDGVNMLSGGVCKEIVDAVSEKMGVKPLYNWHNIHPEPMKRVLDDILLGAGVDVLYNMHVFDVISHAGQLEAVLASGVAGKQAIRGKIFIDATGDGHIAMLADAPWEMGDADGHTMAPTLCTLFERVDFEQRPPDYRYAGSGRKEWREDTEKGVAPLPEHHFVGFFRNGATSGSGNLGHMYGTNPLDPISVSKACIEGRQQSEIYLDFYRSRVSGFQQATLAATASQLGVRESRRIIGEYVMTHDDYICRRRFPDDIGCFAYPIDIHAAGANASEQQNVELRLAQSRFKDGEHYGIPYRALLPKETKNLLVAGRCISCDRAMQSSIRVVPGCMITGQAAGNAAALAVEHQVDLRQVDIKQLQQWQRNQGIWL
jgi:hypothetical protein